MENNYDNMKIKIEEFKKKILGCFKDGKGFDSTLYGLFKELKFDLEDLNLLQYCLDELVEKNYLKKSSSLNHFEYDPGEKLDFGGIN